MSDTGRSRQDDFWVSQPVLEDGEVLRHSFLANRTQGKRAVGGKVFVTDRRLIFAPNAFDSASGGMSIELNVNDVVSIERSKPVRRLSELFSGAWRARLQICVTDGSVEFFVVNHLDSCIGELGKLLPLD